MAFKIYLKDDVANQIAVHKPVSKILEVESIDYLNGCITIGNHYIPISNILFIEQS